MKIDVKRVFGHANVTLIPSWSYASIRTWKCMEIPFHALITSDTMGISTADSAVQ